jgi:hypothetical protein
VHVKEGKKARPCPHTLPSPTNKKKDKTKKKGFKNSK